MDRPVIPCARAYVLKKGEHLAMIDRERRRRRGTFWAILVVAGLDVLLWAAFSLAG